MPASAPNFLRKRTTSTTSLRNSIVSLTTRASRDRIHSDAVQSPSSPLTSAGAATSSSNNSPALSTSVSAVDLFGGAPLQTTRSPIGAASDLDPDFGSSYEGPAAIHFASEPPASACPRTQQEASKQNEFIRLSQYKHPRGGLVGRSSGS